MITIQTGEVNDMECISKYLLIDYANTTELVSLYNDTKNTMFLDRAIVLLEHIVRHNDDFMNGYIVLTYCYSELGMTIAYNDVMSNVYRISGEFSPRA